MLTEIFLVVMAISLSGCAGTSEIASVSTEHQVPSALATITVRRPCGFFAGGVPIFVEDETGEVGRPGPCGQITWGREPGYVALIALNPANTPMHVLIFPVVAGKTYTLVEKIQAGGYCHLEPQNFGRELIVFEEEGKPNFWGKVQVPKRWESELKKLQSGQH